VFADWLQERDDPRAEGYRALARTNRRPAPSSKKGKWGWWNSIKYKPLKFDEGTLPGDWFAAMVGPVKKNWNFERYSSRREAEDAAALAFIKLTPANAGN
jgi:hypothetical protein